MPDRKLAQFLAFLATSDRRFRIPVLYYPLCSAAGGFLLWWLVKGRSLSESLLFGSSMFLLGCFVGLIDQAVRRRNLR